LKVIIPQLESNISTGGNSNLRIDVRANCQSNDKNSN
jgi:hypothetical protein